MGSIEHILLLVEKRDGEALREPVHATRLAGRRFRLLHTPGFVRGIAAGDEFEVVDEDGGFVVRRRGGNVAVQLYASQSIAAFRGELSEAVARLGGVLDGAIDKGMAFTIPASAGFDAIEALFNHWVSEHPGCEWYYGNVYDPADGVTPLGWWE